VDEFVWQGTWWLPESKHHRVTGSLEYDGDRMELATLGSLRDYASPDQIDGVVAHRVGHPSWRRIPIIHGYRRDHKAVTLLNSSGVDMSGPWEINSEGYGVELALVGTHADSDTFEEVAVEFDWLDEWLDPPPLVTDKSIEPDNDVLSKMPIELCRVGLVGGELSLRSGAYGTQGPTAIHLERWSAAFIKTSNPSDWKNLLDTWVRPVQDLLTVSLGRTANIQWVKLRPLRSSPYHEGLCEAIFRIVRPRSTPKSRPGGRQSLRNFDTPTLIMAADVSSNLSEFLRAWMDNRATDGPLTSLLRAHMYAPFMYTSQRYGSIFQAVEGLHSREHAGPERTRAEHERRVNSIIDAATAAGIGTDDLRWAKAVLTSKNDKKLSQRLQELVEASGPLGQAILGAAPTFCSDAASLRSGVSHPGGSGSDSIADQQYWHGEVLVWLARSLLLRRAGLQDSCTRASERFHFQQSLERLAEYGGDSN